MVTIDARVLVLMTKGQRKELFARAKKDETTVSKLVRTAVDQYLGTRGDSTDAVPASD